MCVFTTGDTCGQFDNTIFTDCTVRCFGYGFAPIGIKPYVLEASKRSNVDYTEVRT